ncbi:MAG: hypothetical protein RIM84_09360 [Alphaproteobacteria bacterium]
MTIDGFTENLADFERLALHVCRTNAPGVIDATGITGPLSEADNLRRACGQGLHGRGIVGTEWHYFYHRQADRDGTMDVFGAVLPISIDGTDYHLVIGQQRRVSNPRKQPVQRTRTPVATLFIPQGDGWTPLWNYVNPLTVSFNRPRGDVPSPGEQALDRVWLRNVTIGFDRLVNSLEDAR